MNYEILGNSIPRLHAHVVPRSQIDPRPNGPTPWTFLDDGRLLTDQVEQLTTDLRRLLG